MQFQRGQTTLRIARCWRLSYVPEKHPYRPRIENRLSRLKIAVLLPLSGRAQHSGKALKDALDRLDQGAQEDRVDTGATLKVIDGGTETVLEEAFNDISADPSVFGVIGLFDTRVVSMQLVSLRHMVCPY